MPQMVDAYYDLPEKREKLAVVPRISNGRYASVSICGDSDGLRYLAALLEYMADTEVEKRNMPDGARAHIHLHPDCQLIEHSCEVEICRAEAKGCGALPDYFD